MNIERLQLTPNPELFVIKEIARLSSSRKDKGEDIDGLIKKLIRDKEWSPFEHAVATYKITTSRAISAQLVRHRSFTFQEFSQRYAVVTDCEAVELRKQCNNNRQSSTDVLNNTDLEDKVDNHLSNSMKLYEELLAEDVARETARMVLPMATQTTLVMTGFIRNWIHFFNLRDSKHAQKECRLIAQAIKQDLQAHFKYITF